jgi:hypothetical protein
VLVRPGAIVEPDGELLELANPDVQLEALDADRQRLEVMRSTSRTQIEL